MWEGIIIFKNWGTEKLNVFPQPQSEWHGHASNHGLFSSKAFYFSHQQRVVNLDGIISIRIFSSRLWIFFPGPNLYSSLGNNWKYLEVGKRKGKSSKGEERALPVKAWEASKHTHSASESDRALCTRDGNLCHLAWLNDVLLEWRRSCFHLRIWKIPNSYAK